MEEPKDKISPSGKRTITAIIISLVILVLIVSVVSLTMFLSPDAPEVDERWSNYKSEYLAELTTDDFDTWYERTYPTQKDQGKSGLAELDYLQEPLVVKSKVVIPLHQQKPVSNEPSHDADNHTHDKVTMIPMTILDMVYFLNDHPEISDKDSGVLMSYAVAKETGMNEDEEVDHLAYHIMEKIQ